MTPRVLCRARGLLRKVCKWAVKLVSINVRG